MTDVVIACFRYHFHFGGIRFPLENPAQADHCIEGRSSWNCLLRLVVGEDDVQDRFAYTYDVSHSFLGKGKEK